MTTLHSAHTHKTVTWKLEISQINTFAKCKNKKDWNALFNWKHHETLYPSTHICNSAAIQCIVTNVNWSIYYPYDSLAAQFTQSIGRIQISVKCLGSAIYRLQVKLGSASPLLLCCLWQWKVIHPVHSSSTIRCQWIESKVRYIFTWFQSV